jgi:endonuclease/exonuclease/phosphatase family metal-dependent hydrolase
MAGRSLRLKVATFNAYHGYPRCPHIESRLSLTERGIEEAAPDVLFLQEMSVSPLYGHLTERLVAGLRARGLAYFTVYEPANGSVKEGGAFEEGSAILSRWPIVDAAARRLAAWHPIRRDYHGYEYEEVRIALRATIEVAPRLRLDAFGAHITDVAPTEAVSPRRLQVEDLAAFVAERPSRPMPAIVGGDFNALPDAGELRWLRERGFHDLCAGCDPGPTNDRSDRDLEDPADTANQRIDHLFVVSDAVRVHSARRFLDAAFEVEAGRYLWASDHSGIVADVEVALDRAPR